MEYSMTFLARGVWGSLPMVTMSGPDWTIFSTSTRIFRKSTSRFFRTLAATPLPSLTRPSRTCSVPTYSWLKRWASWLASCITLRARSVKRSYMPTTPTVSPDQARSFCPTPLILDARATRRPEIGAGSGGNRPDQDQREWYTASPELANPGHFLPYSDESPGSSGPGSRTATPADTASSVAPSPVSGTALPIGWWRDGDDELISTWDESS